MKERAEMKIADKLAGLDTLGAGIVYGKDEVWDKLQTRMDRKPLLMLLWPYSVAAAVLLLIGCVAFYTMPQKELVTVTKQATSLPPAIPAPPPPLRVAEVATAERTISINTHGVQHNRNVKHEPVVMTTNPDPVPTVAVAEKKEEMITIPEPPKPVAAIAKTMKVVHINDLERGKYDRLQTEVPATGIALNKLPIVHITEVEREAVEVKEILKNNRLTNVRIPFTKQNYDDAYIKSEQQEPLHFLKLGNTPN